jgi:hypothetical protein
MLRELAPSRHLRASFRENQKQWLGVSCVRTIGQALRAFAAALLMMMSGLIAAGTREY